MSTPTSARRVVGHMSKVGQGDRLRRLDAVRAASTWPRGVPRYVAFHEAGHTVAALALGHTITEVVVRPGRLTPSRKGMSRGFAMVYDFEGSIEADFRSVFGMLAGPAAKRMVSHTNWRYLFFDEVLAGNPKTTGIGKAAALLGKDSSGIIDAFGPIVDAFVRSRRPAIEALALALAEQHRLTGEEAAAVIRAVDPVVEGSIAWVRGMVPPDFPGHAPWGRFSIEPSETPIPGGYMPVGLADGAWPTATSTVSGLIGGGLPR